MNENGLKKFQDLLRTLFQFDCADLDFGIYRILNYKRSQVEAFITERLPQIVDQAFAQYAAADRAAVEHELEEKRQEIRRTLGEQAIDERGQLRKFHETPLGKEYLALREKQARYQVADELKTRIYNDLYAFFSRYYEDGDFVSKRRYGRQETYAIPYSGEEVVLYWANRDQYYIKTGDRFKTYRFRIGDYTVTFELRNIAPEQNGNAGKKRYFVLAHEAPMSFNERDRLLSVAFEYRPLTGAEEQKYGKTEQQKPQDSLNEAAEKGILDQVPNEGLKAELARVVKKNGKEKSTLRWRLDHFTRRNTMDFFIHKDLRGFLRRELDFFIKNEVLLLNELIEGREDDLRQHIQRARVVRQVAEAIIDFLAQVEDFQKKLWEKKKFVIRTEYCLTLDRLPEELWDEVLANEAQIAEWRELYALDDLLKRDGLFNKGLNKDFLRRHPTLVVDTRHFPEDFKWRLLASFDDLDEALDGVLIKSENWQALNLLLEKYREKVKCIYIDPPYNTGSDEFVYKDRYQHSSWLTMMADRLWLGRQMLTEGGTLAIQISDIEDARLKEVLSDTFGSDEFVNRITVRTRAPSGFKTVNVGVFEAAEYLYLYAKAKKKLNYRPQFVEAEYDENYNLYITNVTDPPERWQIVKLGEFIAGQLGYGSAQEAARRMGRTAFKQAVANFALEHAEAVFRYTEIDDLGASKETVELKHLSRKEPNKVFVQRREGKRERLIQNGREISLYVNKLREVGGTKVPVVALTNIWIDVPWEGIAKEGFTRLEKGKKPERLIYRIVDMASNPREFVMDFFLGSGSTCAVSQKARRKWLGIDFDNALFAVALERLKRVLHGEQTGISRAVEWQGGGFFKYQFLEEYEDTLNNLELPRQAEGQKMLELFGDEYLLKYMLEFETQGSPCLLNLDMFKDPFAYKLKVLEGDEIAEQAVDLVETFNYLLGIKVKKIRSFQDNERSYRAVLGEKNGRQMAIIWRSMVGLEDNEEALMKDKAFIEQTILPALLGEAKPDRLLVNGICFVKEAEAIEPEFKRLMFATL
jgi:adenine-specific DNA-methyltransferase